MENEKTLLHGLNHKMEMTEERISKLENKAIETIQSEQRREKIKEAERSLSDLWDNTGRFTICVIGVPEGEKECGTEEMFEKIMA